MLPAACARRWKIANDKEPGDAGSTVETCEGCSHGEKRAELVQLKPRPKRAAGRANGAADKECRACGGTYTPGARNQLYCRKTECQETRDRASVKRYNERRRVAALET